MESKKGVFAPVLFVLFLAVVICFTAVTIYRTPVEVTTVTAGNYPGNLMNGGHFLNDNGVLFYSVPEETGIYSCETNGSDNEKINSTASGYLQVVGKNQYYYQKGDALAVCNYDGTGEKEILSYAKQPLVVGGTVYYLDVSGELCKYSLKYEKSTNLGVFPAGQFLVYSQTVYYLDDEKNIRTCSLTGEEDRLFYEANVDRFMIYGQYIYYIADGQLFSLQMTTETLFANKITAATSFAIWDKYVIFNNNGFYYADMNELVNNSQYQPKKLYAEDCRGLSVDGEDRFYFFNPDNRLCTLQIDGSGLTVLN